MIVKFYESDLLWYFNDLIRTLCVFQMGEHVWDIFAKKDKVQMWAALPLTCCFRRCIPKDRLSREKATVLKAMVDQYRWVIRILSILQLWILLSACSTFTTQAELMHKISLLLRLFRAMQFISLLICVWALFVIQRAMLGVGALEGYEAHHKFLAIKLFILLTTLTQFGFTLFYHSSAYPVSPEAQAIGWTPLSYMVVYSRLAVIVECVLIGVLFPFAFPAKELESNPRGVKFLPETDGEAEAEVDPELQPVLDNEGCNERQRRNQRKARTKSNDKPKQEAKPSKRGVLISTGEEIKVSFSTLKSIL